MAKMIPELNKEQLAALEKKNIAEHVVYLRLKEQLPADWVVRYDYTFCLQSRNGAKADGQADFIVLIPHQGLMFIEVKGPEGFDCVLGQCYWKNADGSRGKAAENPFAQAQGNKHTIVKRLAQRLGVDKKLFPGRYGHIVAFPRAKAIGNKPDSHEPQIVLLYEDMNCLRAKILNAFEVFGFEWVGQKFNSAVMGQIEKILTDDLKVVPVMAAEMDDEDRAITALTQSQADAYNAVLGNTRLRVEGVAGSGKTLIGLWAAQEFSKTGKTLFLCFNRMLAAWLNEKHNRAGNIEIWNFHALAAHCCGRAKLPLSADQTDEFWKTTVPILFGEALEVLSDFRFDAIVVDEAQDFYIDWWLPVEMLLRNPEGSKLHIFLDPKQSVYGVAQDSIKTSMTYELKENCRNTRSITKYCGQVISTDIPARPGSPDGIKPAVLSVAASPGNRAKIVKDVVNGWLSEKVCPSRIAILSPWQKGNSASSLTHLNTICNIPVSAGVGEETIKQWMNDGLLLGTTTKAFKGMEADCVVISDIPKAGVTGFSSADLYVAASRAKLRLVLIPDSQAAANELNGWLQQ